MKVGIIRCRKTEDKCPGTSDFKVATDGTHAFEAIGSSEVIGYVSCGGCPGKGATSRAESMIERGAEAIAFASCISIGGKYKEACPYYIDMRDDIKETLGNDIKIIEYTH